MKGSPVTPMIRCAIYTRKSTEEGLEMEYNSLDAQRDAGEAYIRSQLHAGWMLVQDRYDDGAYSGGNMERPALKRLLEDVKSGKVQLRHAGEGAVSRLTEAEERATGSAVILLAWALCDAPIALRVMRDGQTAQEAAAW